MKKYLLVLLIILLMVTLIAGACAAPAPTSAPAPKPAPSVIPPTPTAVSPAPAPTIPVPSSAPTTAPAAKPIELIVGIGHPPTSYKVTKIWIPWSKMLEERTNGRLKLKIYPGGALFPDAQSYQAITTGIADLADCAHSFLPGRFPLSTVMDLPLLGMSSANLGARVFWGIYEEFPEVRAEYPGVHLLWLSSRSPYQLHTAKKPVHSLDDLKGMKIKTLGGMPAEINNALGGVAVVMPGPDTYLALDKGLINGASIPWEAMWSLKLYELLKYHTTVGLFVGPSMYIMNQDKWNSLPPDIQKVINDTSGAWGADNWSKPEDGADTDGINICKKENHEIYNLSPEEMAKWKEKVKPFWDKWINNAESKGLPGKKVLESTMRLVEKYSK